MKYNYVLIRYGEIALKGKNRYKFEDRLVQNIRNVLKKFNNIKVTKYYGRIYVELNGESYELIIEHLKKVFGLVSFSPVKKVDFEIDEIKETALEMINNNVPNSFKIETKRTNKQFPLRSLEVSREVGAYILRNSDNLKVDVHNPEKQINIEIRNEGVFIYSEAIQGVGGMPAESSGKGIILLSGGIDSPVATWYAMKRGLLVEGIHFHTYPLTTKESIQKVIDLGKVISNYSGNFRVHFVPFLDIQKEIKEFAPESYNITIMRRMFIRIADELAKQRNALTLVTGESLGQVASQTLESMYTINEVTNTPIIRPLITMDKQEIIEKAKEIGTYDAAVRPYDDCCSLFVPRKPATKPLIDIAKKAESYMDVDYLIKEALDKTITINLTPHEEIEAKDILFNEIKDLTKNI